MPTSYLVLWSRDRWKALKRTGEEGRPLEVLYGGIHISTPSFSRHCVVPGDRVYVGMVEQGRLHLLARMNVRTIIPVTDYLNDEVLPEQITFFSSILSGYSHYGVGRDDGRGAGQ